MLKPPSRYPKYFKPLLSGHSWCPGHPDEKTEKKVLLYSLGSKDAKKVSQVGLQCQKFF